MYVKTYVKNIFAHLCFANQKVDESYNNKAEIIS